jgi:acyl-CoA dehydrogenase
MNFPVKITEDSFAARAARVVAIAAKHADTVDFEGRFPQEAVDAMKAERLLSIQIPRNLGGESATTTEIAELCSMLGQACAASAMVFAMHHIKLSSLVEHGADSEWHADFMRRIAADQLLIARRRPKAASAATCATASAPFRSMAASAGSRRMRRSFPTAPTPMRS